MSEASADERLTAGMQVFMECLAKAGTQVEKLDKALIDHHIASLIIRSAVNWMLCFIIRNFRKWSRCGGA